MGICLIDNGDLCRLPGECSCSKELPLGRLGYRRSGVLDELWPVSFDSLPRGGKKDCATSPQIPKHLSQAIFWFHF